MLRAQEVCLFINASLYQRWTKYCNMRGSMRTGNGWVIVNTGSRLHVLQPGCRRCANPEACMCVYRLNNPKNNPAGAWQRPPRGHFLISFAAYRQPCWQCRLKCSVPVRAWGGGQGSSPSGSQAGRSCWWRHVWSCGVISVLRALIRLWAGSAIVWWLHGDWLHKKCN